VKLLTSLLSKKKLWDRTLEIFTRTAYSRQLQLLYAYDPQLSQGLTVDEKSAYLRGTLPPSAAHPQRTGLLITDPWMFSGCFLAVLLMIIFVTYIDLKYFAHE
jgi:hypothetical protein